MYDLNSDGSIGFDDFVIFAEQVSAKLPTGRRSSSAAPPVTRSVEENTPAGASPSAIPSPLPMLITTPSRTACAACMRTVFPLARARGSC